MTELHTIQIPDDVDVNTIPRRPYDFDRGDRRFADHGVATRYADRRAATTGIRQVVRMDPDQQGFITYWLVQAVGS